MPGKHTAPITKAQIDMESFAYRVEEAAAKLQEPTREPMKGRRHYTAAEAVIKAHRYAWRRNLAEHRTATTNYLEQVA